MKQLALAAFVAAMVAGGGCNRQGKSSEPDASRYREVTLEVLGMT